MSEDDKAREEALNKSLLSNKLAGDLSTASAQLAAIVKDLQMKKMDVPAGTDIPAGAAASDSPEKIQQTLDTVAAASSAAGGKELQADILGTLTPLSFILGKKDDEQGLSI